MNIYFSNKSQIKLCFCCFVWMQDLSTLIIWYIMIIARPPIQTHLKIEYVETSLLDMATKTWTC